MKIVLIKLLKVYRGLSDGQRAGKRWLQKVKPIEAFLKPRIPPRVIYMERDLRATQEAASSAPEEKEPGVIVIKCLNSTSPDAHLYHVTNMPSAARVQMLIANSASSQSIGEVQALRSDASGDVEGSEASSATSAEAKMAAPLNASGSDWLGTNVMNARPKRQARPA